MDVTQCVDVNALRIAYRKEGNGQPVVFLHGFFGDHRVWRWQYELADQYTVVSWDAPGCGRSSSPPANFRMSNYADCLASFIQALELGRPHIVGNSFGGTLALELCVRHPDVIRSVVAADTYAGWSGSFSPEIVAGRLSQSLPDLDLPADMVVAKWMPGFVTASAPQSLKDELGEIISGFHPAGMRVMIQALAEADLRDVLVQVTLPTLLIWGDKDVRSPLTVAEDLQARILGSRLVMIPGAGHLSHAEAADRFNAELRSFLQSIPG